MQKKKYKDTTTKAVQSGNGNEYVNTYKNKKQIANARMKKKTKRKKQNEICQ